MEMRDHTAVLQQGLLEKVSDVLWSTLITVGFIH